MSQAIRFDGKVAIVTGAGTGLGRSHAMMFARRGAKVVVNDLGVGLDGSASGPGAADRVVEEIRATGGEAVASRHAVDDWNEAQAAVAVAAEHFGRVDIVVNNAGILRDKSFGKMDMEDFDKVLRVHLNGSAYITRAAWPLMQQNNYGRIVFTLSNTGLYGNFGQANYGAAKAGLIGLMNVLKVEGARYGILANAIAPMAATRMTESTMADGLLSRFKPEYASAAVAFMCSERFKESGRIISAAGGHFSVVEILSSAGVSLQGTITAEAVSEAWEEISDMIGAGRFASAAAEVQYVADKITKISAGSKVTV